MKIPFTSVGSGMEIFMDIKFHCSEKANFPEEHSKVRAFLYTDYAIEPHNHDFYEINIVMNGTGVHKIENNSFKVRMGDIFVIRPMVVHAYYDTCELDVFHILLKKDFVSANMSEAVGVEGFLQFMEIEPFLRHHFAEKIFLHCSYKQLNALKTDLNVIDENAELAEKRPEALKEHTVWKIIYMLSGALYEDINSKNSVNKYEQAIISLLEYIHKNYDEKITLETMSKRTYLSRSTLLRAFYDMCGCTPMQYLNKYRCERAAEMLENPDGLSKTQIAHCCGFYDLSHMNRMLDRK